MTTAYSVRKRGVVSPEEIVPLIQAQNYSFVHEQKASYFLSYESAELGFHIVDRLAAFPLFYTVYQGRPVVSESVDDLLPYLDKVELDSIGYYGTGGQYKGERVDRTPFKGILRIPPGHYLEYRNGKMRLQKYWSFHHLKDRPFTGTYEEACEELGFLIRQGVKRCYDFTPDTAVHLSGGLDSGSITAIVCQLSNNRRQAFALLKEDAPLEGDLYESGFISKYKHHFPHLNVFRLDPAKFANPEAKLIPEAGNWHYLTGEGVQDEICRRVKSEGGSTILTGLGGDELASYGHGFQNVSYSLNSDFQASLYLRMIGTRRRMRFRIKAILGMDGNRMDALRAIQAGKNIQDHRNWYAAEFQQSSAELFNRPGMALYWFPSSFDYRLDALQRSYFTIRSDIWNYIGRRYGIDYLHPLLDADLVDFCASIPRDFFRGRKQREMIKTALSSQLPADLLAGGKRPGFFEEKYISKDLASVIIETRQELEGYKKTFAATVYDYKKMDHQLSQFQKLVNRLPDTHQQTFSVIRRHVQNVRQFLTRGAYLNTYFQ